MERIVIFGKGGIGKSTIACGISASLAAGGKRVLHVGCDPKHDSTAALLRGKLIEPVVDRIEKVKGVKAEDIVVRSPLGVDCVEAKGPSTGTGSTAMPRSSTPSPSACHLVKKVGLDLAIGGSEFPVDPPVRHDPRMPGRMYFGFPNFFCHALHESPFLGFRGWAWFVQQMVNAVAQRPRVQRAEYQGPSSSSRSPS